MASLNQCTLLGNLTRDPELKYTAKGTAVANFGIAMNHVYYRDEEKVEEVCFIDCDAWGRIAEIANEYLKKGSPVLLVGRLKLDSWDDKQTGQRRSRHKISVEQLRLMSSGGGHRPDDKDDPRGRPAEPGEGYRERSSSAPPATRPPPVKRPPPKDPDLDQPEDEIPF